MKKNEITPVITHTMADGSLRTSIEGYKVPLNSSTKTAYFILAKYANSANDKAPK